MTDYNTHGDCGSHDIFGTNILLVTSGSKREKGHRLFEDVELPRSNEVAALFVTSRSSPTDCLDAWQATVGKLPGKLAIVGEGYQGQKIAAEQGSRHRKPAVTVRDIRDTADLIEVGIAVAELLEKWNTEDRCICVWFESLTEQLHRSESGHVYRFLAELTSRLSEMDAIGCFRIDADSTNEAEIKLIEPLFDDIVRRDGHAADTLEKGWRTVASQGEQEPATEDDRGVGFVYPEDASSDRDLQATSDEETGNGGDPA